MTSAWKRMLQPERLIWVLLFLLLAERLILFKQLGPDYMSHSDDDAYIESGLYFIRTGTISMWGPHPSAMIMPGMPVLIGLVSLVAPDLTSLRVLLKLIWIGGGYSPPIIPTGLSHFARTPGAVWWRPAVF